MTRRAGILGILWTAAMACAPTVPGGTADPTPVARVSVELQHLVHARANLEFDDSVNVSAERWPQPVLDSIALALATLQHVDSLSRVQLGPQEHWTELWSTIVVLLGYRDAPSTRALRGCIARTSTAGPRPQRMPCWPAVDSLLLTIAGASLKDLSTDSLSFGHFRIVVPVPVNRWWVMDRLRRLEDSAGADGGRLHVLPEPAMNIHEYERVDRRALPWTYTIVRGYGDCPSGCIHRRYYVYRYDPRTGRAWKEREYGDPYPPPSPTG